MVQSLSEGLPLNVYCETLLHNKILRVIKKNHVMKYLEILAEIAELNDDREESYEQRGKCLNFGNDEDSTVGVKTAEVLRFNTSKPGDERISFEEYVDRMKEGQNDIYCITGESITAVSSWSFRELSHKKGHEVPCVADPVDEYDVQQPKESDGTKPNDNDNLELFKADDDNKKTYCLVGIGRGDTSLAIDIKSHESAVAGPTEQLTGSEAPRAAAQHRSTQQDNNHHRKQRQHVGQTEGERKEEKGQGGREKGRKDEGGRVQEGKRKEKEREAEVKKDVTDWTVVTRNRRQREMVQIFVRVNGSKATPMEVSLTDDKVEDVMKRIQSDEDVYMTMQGKALRTSEKLKSCGVTDGCTVQVTSRLRGGGKHKDKKGQKERKRAVKPKGPEQKSEEEPKSDEGPALIQMDEVLRRMEENEEFQKIIDWVSEGSEGEVQQKVQSYLAKIRMSWMNKEKFEHLEGGVWRAVEARRPRGGTARRT